MLTLAPEVDNTSCPFITGDELELRITRDPAKWVRCVVEQWSRDAITPQPFGRVWSLVLREVDSGIRQHIHVDVDGRAPSVRPVFP